MYELNQDKEISWVLHIDLTRCPKTRIPSKQIITVVPTGMIKPIN